MNHLETNFNKDTNVYNLKNKENVLVSYKFTKKKSYI